MTASLVDKHERLIAAFDGETQRAFLRWLVREDGNYAICEGATNDWGASGWDQSVFTFAYAVQAFLLDQERTPAITSALASVDDHIAYLRAH